MGIIANAALWQLFGKQHYSAVIIVSERPLITFGILFGLIFISTMTTANEAEEHCPAEDIWMREARRVPAV